MFKRTAILTLLLSGIVSCGGGGGGSAPAGGGTTTPSNGLSVSTNTLSFTAADNDVKPSNKTINGTISGVSSSVLIEVYVSGSAVTNAAFTLTGSTTGQLSVTPNTPAVLGIGTHKATITIYACTQPTTSCKNNGPQISNSPKIINITYTVSSSGVVTSRCDSITGDTTKNPTDGSAIYTKSHTQGSPTYYSFITRKLADGSDVTIDYMLHDRFSPKGVVVLIAGGGLKAKIEGTNGSAPTRSSGNFLVRSAQRYHAAGYRVITIDRPSDAADGVTYGAFNVHIDKYRHSMQHAVDIASILRRENLDNYNVIISGTSRGAISAAAMNTLAAGIAMSSPLVTKPSVVGFAGYPVGSAELPLSWIERSSHILFHTNDLCAVTLPNNVSNLFSNLLANGNDVSANRVSGGFQSFAPTKTPDVCGAFDFHGFAGIENCAVTKETSWMNNLMTRLSLNTKPIARNQTVSLGTTIKLTATDADIDTLTFAIPYGNTSLGGTVVTDDNGSVTYTAPVGITGTEDSFAFTVTDGKGGVSTAVIKITIPGV